MVHVNRFILFFILTSFLSPAFADWTSMNQVLPHARPLIPFDHFAVDARLRSNVDFWIQIYTRYSNREGVIHDAKYIDHIYEVVDLNQVPGDPVKFLKQAKLRWKNALLSAHQKRHAPGTMNEDERKVYDLFQDVSEPNKFLGAASRKRLRIQQGQKEHFLEGYRQSGRFLPVMEEIFRKMGMPVELTRLPFVESSFNIRARSKVGASGVWQFMPSTGRLYLKVNEAVDERNDPVRATEAAARLLKDNFESLGRWPLAVTAYNHGCQGMMRAVRTVGSQELEDVVDTYRGRTFGFASSNFFTELLAAIEVERNAERYFGKVERLKPHPSYEVRIPDFIDISELARFMKLDLAEVRSLNPGLSDAVFSGKLLLPAGYRLRLPLSEKSSQESAAQVFLVGYAEIPSTYKLLTQPFQKYVRRGKRLKKS